MPHWPTLVVSPPLQRDKRDKYITYAEGQGERVNTILDPSITPVGEEQMLQLSNKIQSELSEGMPAPTRIFTSVAWRACQTTMGAFGTPQTGVSYTAIYVSAI